MPRYPRHFAGGAAPAAATAAAAACVASIALARRRHWSHLSFTGMHGVPSDVNAF